MRILRIPNSRCAADTFLSHTVGTEEKADEEQDDGTLVFVDQQRCMITKRAPDNLWLCYRMGEL